MSLADIKIKIETDARKEAEGILEKARTEAHQILADADSTKEQIAREYRERLDKDHPEILRRREIVAQLDVKKLRLEARRTLIEEAFQSACQYLGKLPKEQYASFAETLLKNAVSSGKESVLVGPNESVINQAWLDSFNEREGTKLTLSREKAKTDAGFVVRNGRVDINCSFKMLVDWLREELETDVVSRLFSS